MSASDFFEEQLSRVTEANVTSRLKAGYAPSPSSSVCFQMEEEVEDGDGHGRRSSAPSQFSSAYRMDSRHSIDQSILRDMRSRSIEQAKNKPSIGHPVTASSVGKGLESWKTYYSLGGGDNLFAIFSSQAAMLISAALKISMNELVKLDSPDGNKILIEKLVKHYHLLPTKDDRSKFMDDLNAFQITDASPVTRECIEVFLSNVTLFLLENPYVRSLVSEKKIAEAVLKGLPTSTSSFIGAGVEFTSLDEITEALYRSEDGCFERMRIIASVSEKGSPSRPSVQPHQSVQPRPAVVPPSLGRESRRANAATSAKALAMPGLAVSSSGQISLHGPNSCFNCGRPDHVLLGCKNQCMTCVAVHDGSTCSKHTRLQEQRAKVKTANGSVRFAPLVDDGCQVGTPLQFLDTGANEICVASSHHLDSGSLNTSRNNHNDRVFAANGTSEAIIGTGTYHGVEASLVNNFTNTLASVSKLAQGPPRRVFIFDSDVGAGIKLTKPLRRQLATFMKLAEATKAIDIRAKCVNGLYVVEPLALPPTLPPATAALLAPRTASTLPLNANASFYQDSVEHKNLRDLVRFWHETLAHPSEDLMCLYVKNAVAGTPQRAD